MKLEKPILLEKDVVLPAKETIEVYNIGTVEKPRYIVTEHTVRRELSTHKQCEKCGSVFENNSYCDSCSSKSENESYWKKPFKEWDGKTPLVIYNSDQYFFDAEDVEFYIEENKIDPKELNLMICYPNNCIQIGEEYFTDEMPENFDCLSDFDKGLVSKINDLNFYISTLKPMSWSEGNYRTEL